MTPSSSTDPARRGTTLVVGRSEEITSLAGDADGPTVTVESLMEAIGELATHRRSDSIRRVIVCAADVRGAQGRPIDALRLVDPSVEVIIHDPHETPPDQAEIPEPTEAFAPDEEYCSADGDCSTASDCAVDSDEDAESDDPPEPEMTGEPCEEPASSEEPIEPASEAVAEPTPQSEAEAMSQYAEQLVSPMDHVSADEPLGDVDMLEAVMSAPGDVQEVALNLIRQQTGWPGLELLDDAAQANSTMGYVAVTRGAHYFGCLAATNVAEAELEPWACWLASWLDFARIHDEHREWAFTDDLTGVGNRRFFNRFLRQAMDHARRQRRVVTVMVFDIDDFKQYNDRFGHEAGDDILRETVSLLTSVIRKGDRVCRIGGDEFAVVFADPENPREPGSSHPEEIEHIAVRFQQQIAAMRFPKLGIEAKAALTISGGLATYPWDGLTPEELLRLADQRAMHSKRIGKNVITYGPETAEGGEV